MASALAKGSDGRPRCRWGASTPDYEWYHDEEWGRPVTDDRGLYERMVLEGFQSGLSWLTILRKRDNFRAAFANFEIEAVAGFGERDVKRLLADAGIVRHRGKIEAAIANARAAAALDGIARRADLVVRPRRPTPRAALARRAAGAHPRVDGAQQGAEEARLPLRGPHHRLRDHAGLRPRERPHRRLLGAGCGGEGAPRLSCGGWMNALSQSA